MLRSECLKIQTKGSSMLTYLFIAASLLAVLILTLLHMPRLISVTIMRLVPAWAQAIVVHAFGYLIGGVTGHVTGALMSLPYYYLCRHWLRPMMLGTRGAALAGGRGRCTASPIT
jgi:hypothetical protein